MDALVEKERKEIRFKFGKNWKDFLKRIGEEQILGAETHLQDMLEIDDMRGKRFIDMGCGSGLISLAAKRMGAYVHSFDIDHQSVACTIELRNRYFPLDKNWIVEKGSVLDSGYLKSLGKFDIVYSWGVLHHTGFLWQAMQSALIPVADGGRLCLAIYNDQGLISSFWRVVKRIYNSLPQPLRLPYVLLWFIPIEFIRLIVYLVKLRLGRYIRSWSQYHSNRGMSRWHDFIDWIGGYPFEVARPENVIEFYRQRGFTQVKAKTVGRNLGCNEFVFEKLSAEDR